MKPIEPEKACPFVGQTLRDLRDEVGNEATVLGFVGCPYTLATYLVEVSNGKLEIVEARCDEFLVFFLAGGTRPRCCLFVVAVAHTRVVVFVANSGWIVHYCQFDFMIF